MKIPNCKFQIPKKIQTPRPKKASGSRRLRNLAAPIASISRSVLADAVAPGVERDSILAQRPPSREERTSKRQAPHKNREDRGNRVCGISE